MGVLLDAVVHGLQKQSQIEPTGLPRMADFALVVTACETMFWPAGTFRTAYDSNRAEVVEALIEADPVASAVRLLIGPSRVLGRAGQRPRRHPSGNHRKSGGGQELARGAADPCE